MAEQNITPSPGICFSQTFYSAGKNVAYVTQGTAFHQGSNRWSNGYNVEFVAGYAQKVAGWVQATADILIDEPTATLVWRDHHGAGRVGIGTYTHLYYMLNGHVTDITPMRTLVTGTATLSYTTLANSPLVTVADPNAIVAVGDYVFLSADGGQTPIDGATLFFDDWYFVESVTPGVGYVVESQVNATGSAGPTPFETGFLYPRTNLTDPFTTTAGSRFVTVTHVAHGANSGNFVFFSGASSVGGATIDGEYRIFATLGPDHYTIELPTPAPASQTGGGTVSVFYLVQTQQVSPVPGVAYGIGAYNLGFYSSTAIDVAPPLHDGWTLAAYGNQLLACPIGGTIYIYNPVLGGRAYEMHNAPKNINAMFVTPERFVVALGLGSNNQMQIAWSDQNNYTIWGTTPTNTANTGRTLIGGSFMVGGIAVRPGQSLIFSDRACFAMTYIGGQEIYSTLLASDNSGLVDPTAVCEDAGIAYWMADHDFFVWNGSVSRLPTDDIRAFVFGEGGLNRSLLGHCTAVTNRAKRQVRWYYPRGSADDPNAGIIYSYDQQCWSPLTFSRSAASDANLLPLPVSADINGVYFDESGTDAMGHSLPYLLEMGFVDVSNGDRNMDIFGFIPDFQVLSGHPELTIMTQFYPSETSTIDGPFIIDPTTTRIDLRSDGKLFKFSLSDDETGSNFRLGICRADIQPSGARR